MTDEQQDRIITAFEVFASSFQWWVELQEKRLSLEYPPPGEPVDAQIVRVGESSTDEPESREEYEEFPDNQQTSFEQILTKLKERSEEG